MKKILEKLKDVLSEEDLKSLELAIKEMVSEEVSIRTEEKIKSIEEKAEAYCEENIAKGIESEKEELIKEYDEKLVQLEDTMVDRLDKFIELEISEQISDEAISKIAINETFAPIIESIQDAFEKQYVALDTEGDKAIKDLKNECEDLKESNSSLMADKMELSELAEKAATNLYVEQKVSDLIDSDKQRVKKLCEDKSFDDVESKIGSYIELVESSNKEDINENKDNDFSNVSNNDGIDEKELNENVNKDEKEEEEKEDLNEDNEFMKSVNNIL